MDVFGLGLKIKEEGAATVQASLKRLAGQMLSVTAVVGGLGLAMKKMMDETAQAQAGQAQLAATLASTKGVSGQTIESLNNQAQSLSQLTAFTDDAIIEAQGLLLTFTNIRGSFADATRLTLDLARAMKVDVRSAAMQLGKALNDPISGVTALARAGVQLTDEQKKNIETLVQQNKLLDAQKIVLGELQTQIGGSAEAYRRTLGGALEDLRNAFDDLFVVQNASANGFSQSINAMADTLRTAGPFILDTMNMLVKAMVTVGTSATVIGIAVVRAFKSAGNVLSNFSLTIKGIGETPEDFAKMADAQMKVNEEFEKSDIELERMQVQLQLIRDTMLMPTEMPKFTAATLLSPTEAKTTRRGKGGLSADDYKKALDEFNAQFAKDSEAAFNARMDMQEREAKAYADAVAQMDAQYLRDWGEAFDYQMQQEAERLRNSIQNQLSEGVAAGLENGLRAGLETALMTGNISDAFKQMGQAIVRSMASAMVNVALQALKFAEMLKAIKDFLILRPELAIVAAVAMLALARSLGGGGGGGGGGGSSFAGGGMASMQASASPAQQIIFGATSATTAAGMTPRQSMNVTVIGPNDPSAQRAIQELMMKADSRGRIG